MRRILRWLTGGTGAPEPAAPCAERTWTSSDGLTLFARDYAACDGPARLPVVCLHGLTRNSRDFEAVAPTLAAEGRRVLALDVRGRGRSDRDPDPVNYSMPVYAGDVAALLSQAGIDRAVFVGTSMGGLITMTLATLRPDLVAAAVLNDVGPEISPVGLARIAGYVGKSEPAASWAEAAARARAINGSALPGLSDADWERFARRTFREEAPGRIVADYDPAIASAFAASPSGQPQPTADLWPLFGALALGRPLLLVRGGESDLLEASAADRMQALAPHMRRVDIDGVGHAPTLEEPAAREALKAFLETAP